MTSGFFIEYAYQIRRGEIEYQSDYFGGYDRRYYTEQRALFRPAVLLCAEVLTDKGRARHRKAGYRQKREPLHLGVCAVARGCKLAEGIYLRLHDNVCEPYDRVLHARRQAVADNFLEHVLVKSDFFNADGVNFSPPQKVDKA